MTYRLHIIDDQDDHFVFDYATRHEAEVNSLFWHQSNIRDQWIEEDDTSCWEPREVFGDR